jgi:hypothetical protein
MMGGNRSTRSAKQLPTKEVFATPELAGGNAAFGEKGAHVGIVIDDDDEEAYLEMLCPHDFSKLSQLKVAVIPLDTLAPGTDMTMTVQVDHGRPTEPYNQHTKTLAKGFTAVNEIITEVDITDLVDGTVQLQAKDYIGVKLSRVAGQNANLNFLGVKLKYTAKND